MSFRKLGSKLSRFCCCKKASHKMSAAVPVQLYVYDLSQGMARILGPQLLGLQLEGVWHTGVVVHGKEYFFGQGSPGAIGNPATSGVKFCTPGTLTIGQPQQIIQLGNTEVPEPLLHEYLLELASSTFRADTYSLFDHNCNHFSNELSQFLTGNSIPAHILNLPQEVLNTPLGGMLRQMFGRVNVL